MTLSEIVPAVGLLVLVLLLSFSVTLAFFARRWRAPEDTAAIAVLRALNRIYVLLFHRLWGPLEQDPLPRTGACIVVANHQSGVDPLLIAAVSQRWIRFLMAREYYETRGFKWLFRLLDCIPVRRDGNDLSATRSALKTLKAAKVIGIFPQGGIRNAGDPLDTGRSGVALLALRTGAPVVPLYIDGSPPSPSVFKALLIPSRSRVIAGAPLHFPRHDDKPTREDLKRVTAQILHSIARLRQGNNQGSPDLSPGCPEDSSRPAGDRR